MPESRQAGRWDPNQNLASHAGASRCFLRFVPRTRGYPSPHPKIIIYNKKKKRDIMKERGIRVVCRR